MASAAASSSRSRDTSAARASSNAGSGATSAVASGSRTSSGSGSGIRDNQQQAQPQRRPRPQITGQGGGSTILVNSRQRGNPVLQAIKNVGWEYGDIVPDYQVGVTACVLFLSLRYHRLHPEYVHQRISTLGNMYSLRILLVQCDVGDHQPAVKELSKIALISRLTIMMAWSSEEAGKYIEAFKMYEHKPPDVIKERISDDYLSQLNNVLTSVRGVNKTDVMTLTSNFGSLKRIAQAGSDEMSLLPGFGEVKVKRLREAFSQPFRTGSSTGSTGDARTMRARKAAAALRAAEAGEELPDALLDLERDLSSSSSSKQRQQNGTTPAPAVRGSRARDASVDEFGLADADEQAMWQAAEALERDGTGGGLPRQDAGGDTTKSTDEPAEESTGMSAALRAAAMWRDGGWKSNTVRPTARAANGEKEQPVAQQQPAPERGEQEKAAQEEPSLEDFENLTEEEQLAMAMKMSTGGE